MAEWEIKASSGDCIYKGYAITIDKDICLFEHSEREKVLCQQSTCPKRVEEKTCEWTRQGVDILFTVYKTECGKERMIKYDGYCCRYCGGKIIIKEK